MADWFSAFGSIRRFAHRRGTPRLATGHNEVAGLDGGPDDTRIRNSPL